MSAVDYWIEHFEEACQRADKMALDLRNAIFENVGLKEQLAALRDALDAADAQVAALEADRANWKKIPEGCDVQIVTPAMPESELIGYLQKHIVELRTQLHRNYLKDAEHNKYVQDRLDLYAETCYALESDLAALRAEREGWRWVPVAPTQTMINRGFETDEALDRLRVDIGYLFTVMCKAAPPIDASAAQAEGKGE
jgi:hypothetical protein